ncbi:hypothetical protein Sme01_35750 [Sphaerisporangium melleum]|uniref:FtsH ternary system domain-containing protein n=1 Tax=Sphaerisporangium melleum TaxID=321316 RepID=A0A917VMZ3_9ACTN|nr:molecular chaperone DnaJ [Sphaerisporangium melleum]GGK97260.1 hypothetical protein GCM10007964_44400 [Sphaerisporangium melleum]GII71099.1 hypothetical protein Sme01_35750 [Sphaerisporangium melleum]
MCNPRRIQVRATRRLAESWDHEVRRAVELTGEAVGEARVGERLAASVGAPTLAALARVLARTPGWEEDDDGVFRHPLDGGTISYDPATRELEITARVSERVRATGTATATVRAELDDVLDVTGTGTYYDDGWGGITRRDATAQAGRAAEEELDRQAEQVREQRRRRAEEQAGAGVAEEARRRARDSLDAVRGARGRRLDEQAARVLAVIGAEGRALFHRALAEAYRDAILAYARTRRATGITCSESDGGVLDIEFELEV